MHVNRSFDPNFAISLDMLQFSAPAVPPAFAPPRHTNTKPRPPCNTSTWSTGCPVCWAISLTMVRTFLRVLTQASEQFSALGWALRSTIVRTA